MLSHFSALFRTWKQPARSFMLSACVQNLFITFKKLCKSFVLSRTISKLNTPKPLFQLNLHEDYSDKFRSSTVLLPPSVAINNAFFGKLMLAGVVTKFPTLEFCRSKWSRGLGHGSAAVFSLGLRFRIPPRTWMYVVSVVCCQVSASGWSLAQRSPTDCAVSQCDREAYIMRRPWPPGGLLHHSYIYI